MSIMPATSGGGSRKLSDIAGMPEHVSSCVVSPVFIGRGQQTDLLAKALANTRAGQPAVILIGGEAGVGKSRLVSEFSARASQARVLTGGCMELGAAGLPYGPFTTVLRQLVHDLGTTGVRRLLAGQSTAELTRLVPELGEIAKPAKAPEPAAHDEDPYQGEARARLFRQVLVLLKRLATMSPVVLVIEDVHWADRSTRDLLTFLVSNHRLLHGVLIVVTFRSDELHRCHPARPLLAELGEFSWVDRCELPRLTKGEASAQIAAILAHDPEPALVDVVFRRTDGNPLYVEQLLGCSVKPPPTLRDVVLASAQQLPDETVELLRTASAGGVRVAHPLLAAVTGLDEAEVARRLRPAVASNLLLADAAACQFRHALIHEAMRDDLLAGERSRLHAKFAEAIAADSALAPAGRAAIEQAHHWYVAHDVTAALISAWQAAAESGEVLAYAEQLTMLSRVLELWDSVPDAERHIGADHVQVLEEAAQVACACGEESRGACFASAAFDALDGEANPARAALLLERRNSLQAATQASRRRNAG